MKLNKVPTLKKLKHFTHTDLDGVGCAIVSKYVFGEDFVHEEYCDYKEVNEKVTSFIEGPYLESFGYIYITDISVTEEVAEKLNAIHLDPSLPDIYLIDHHKTAGWLNRYDWAFVEDWDGHYKTSATSLLADHFGSVMQLPDSLYDFAEIVRRYDTWDWKTIFNDEYPKDLNDLLYLIGRTKFIQNRLHSEDAIGLNVAITNEEAVLLKQRKEEIKHYIKKKAKQMVIKDNKGYVFAESHISELGSVLGETNSDLDCIVLIDLGASRLSFRTIHDHFDVSEFAKTFGGGGHPKAAGAQINVEVVASIIGEIMD